MNKYNNYVDLFTSFYSDEDVKINEKLSQYVNFKVGGPADILVTPRNKEQIIRTVNIIQLTIICLLSVSNKIWKLSGAKYLYISYLTIFVTKVHMK